MEENTKNTKNTKKIVLGVVLFAVVIAFRYLLPKEEFLVFKRALAAEIDGFLNSTSHVSEEELLGAMGFPENWKKITLYRI